MISCCSSTYGAHVFVQGGLDPAVWIISTRAGMRRGRIRGWMASVFSRVFTLDAGSVEVPLRLAWAAVEPPGLEPLTAALPRMGVA